MTTFLLTFKILKAEHLGYAVVQAWNHKKAVDMVMELPHVFTVVEVKEVESTKEAILIYTK